MDGALSLQMSENRASAVATQRIAPVMRIPNSCGRHFAEMARAHWRTELIPAEARHMRSSMTAALSGHPVSRLGRSERPPVSD